VAFYGTLAIWLCTALASIAETPSPTPRGWEKTVTPLPRGDFPNPRPLVATYNFGWNNIVAATGEVRFDQHDGRFQILADGQTVGIVRALWKFDVHHRALADVATLRPVTAHQVDITRRKTVTTDLTFKPNGVERIRTDTKSNQTAQIKNFSFPGEVFDLHSALLRLRSQALHDGDVYRLVVYPTNSPYLATITVSSHSPVTIATGSYPAIELDLRLNKITRNGELAPHKKFRHATIWVSDNSDRLLLRVEASIFVGTVFAELQSIRFPNDKSPEPSPSPEGSGT
jgi:hypothetical protein